jgi:hypothetical protein
MLFSSEISSTKTFDYSVNQKELRIQRIFVKYFNKAYEESAAPEDV